MQSSTTHPSTTINVFVVLVSLFLFYRSSARDIKGPIATSMWVCVRVFVYGGTSFFFVFEVVFFVDTYYILIFVIFVSDTYFTSWWDLFLYIFEINWFWTQEFWMRIWLPEKYFYSFHSASSRLPVWMNLSDDFVIALVFVCLVDIDWCGCWWLISK